MLTPIFVGAWAGAALNYSVGMFTPHQIYWPAFTTFVMVCMLMQPWLERFWRR